MSRHQPMLETLWMRTDTADIATRALEVLDLGVVVLSRDPLALLLANRAARRLLGENPQEWLPAIAETALAQARSPADPRMGPPPLKTVIRGRSLYISCVRVRGKSDLEVVSVREEVLRQDDAYRRLHARYGINLREWQIIGGIRAGKTNAEIAAGLRIKTSTVNAYVHELLARLGVRNRTALANLVADILSAHG
jgi:DNA-binding CsgD family transcriptional regulator